MTKEEWMDLGLEGHYYKPFHDGWYKRFKYVSIAYGVSCHAIHADRGGFLGNQFPTREAAEAVILTLTILNPAR